MGMSGHPMGRRVMGGLENVKSSLHASMGTKRLLIREDF